MLGKHTRTADVNEPRKRHRTENEIAEVCQFLLLPSDVFREIFGLLGTCHYHILRFTCKGLHDLVASFARNSFPFGWETVTIDLVTHGIFLEQLKWIKDIGVRFSEQSPRFDLTF